MPFAARKGTPFPIVLNASDNETSSGITNVCLLYTSDAADD